MTKGIDLIYSSDDETRYNLVLLRQEREILLGRKTRGFGKGLYVMPGGKNEYFIEDAQLGFRPPQHDAARELEQETGVYLDPAQLEQVAELEIFDPAKRADKLKIIQVFEGHVEGKPTLQPSDEFDDMKWVDYASPEITTPHDYQFWLPRVMGGQAVMLCGTVNPDGIITPTSLRARPRHSLELFEEISTQL